MSETQAMLIGILAGSTACRAGYCLRGLIPPRTLIIETITAVALTLLAAGILGMLS
jgi:hypothetical protein